MNFKQKTELAVNRAITSYLSDESIEQAIREHVNSIIISNLNYTISSAIQNRIEAEDGVFVLMIDRIIGELLPAVPPLTKKEKTELVKEFREWLKEAVDYGLKDKVENAAADFIEEIVEEALK